MADMPPPYESKSHGSAVVDMNPMQPMQSPGQPMQSPGQPMQSPGQPMQSPGKPMPSPGQPMQSPGQPMQSPGEGAPMYQPVPMVAPAPMAMVIANNFSNDPIVMTCPYCQARISTRVEVSYPAITWVLVAMSCCVIGCFALCILCSDCAKRHTHYCAHCGAMVGKDKN